MTNQALAHGAAAHGNDPSSVKQRAYARFQMQLLSGNVKPGQFISQRAIVDMLDVSLGAVRELLPRLEAEGLVQVHPQRGIQITTVDLPMIRNAYQLRSAFEREAVISAVSKLTDEVIDAQLDLHERILARAAAEAFSMEIAQDAQQVDTGMHMALVEATGNDLLINAYNVNAIRVRLINVDRMQMTQSVLPTALGNHLEILRAIKARDTAAAVSAMEAHIRAARDRAVAM